MPSNPNPYHLLIILLLGVFLVQSVHLMTYAAFVDSNWCEAEVAFMKEGIGLLLDKHDLEVD